MLTNKGQTFRIENPLVLSDAECHDIAKGLVEDFGTPIFEAIGCSYCYLNLFPEQNDMAMVWDKNSFSTNLFIIVACNYHWDILTDSCSFNFDDSGLNFTDEGLFIYDRDKQPVGGTVIKYDKGYVWDMTYKVNGKESDIPASEFVHDISFN